MSDKQSYYHQRGQAGKGKDLPAAAVCGLKSRTSFPADVQNMYIRDIETVRKFSPREPLLRGPIAELASMEVDIRPVLRLRPIPGQMNPVHGDL